MALLGEAALVLLGSLRRDSGAAAGAAAAVIREARNVATRTVLVDDAEQLARVEQPPVRLASARMSDRGCPDVANKQRRGGVRFGNAPTVPKIKAKR